MAVRRISPLEQNVEKIVLAVAAAGLLGVLAWQFLPGSRTTVVVPTSARQSEPVPVADAFERVAIEARKLQAEMGSGELPSDFPKLAPKSLSEEFTKSARASVSPVRELAAFGDVPKIVIDELQPNSRQVAAGGNFHVPAIPALTGITANRFVASIAHEEVAASPELAALVPAQEPHNKAAVSIEASFEGTALRAAMALDPDGEAGPIRPLPPVWWDAGRTHILLVEVQREEQAPDGTWAGRRMLPPMPARFTLVNRLKDLKTLDQMEPVLADAQVHAEEIQRPAWYARPDINGVLIGEDWVAPSDAVQPAAAGNPQAERERKNLQLKTKIKQRDAKIKERDELRRSGGGRPAPGRSGPGGGGRLGPRGTGAGDDNSRKIEQLEREIKKLDDEIKALQNELGVKETKAPPKSLDAGNILDDQAIQVWAHDVTAVRGKTYRYMMRVWINNPLFAKANVAAGEQVELAKTPALASAQSEWSEPVTVHPETYYFITSANENPVIRGVQAGAELFVFDWGYWRRGLVLLNPGDALVASTKIPDIEGLRALAPARAARPGGPVMPPGMPAPGRAPAAPALPVNPPPGGNSPSEDAPKDNHDFTKPMTIVHEGFMLDVVRDMMGSGTDRGSFQVYLRDEGGLMVVKDPVVQKADNAYKVVLASSKAGELRNESLREEVSGRPATPDTRRPPRPDEPPPPPPVAPPGGGGGGGG